MGKIVFLTGPPRCGKTTIIRKVVSLLQDSGLEAEGMVTTEIESNGKRLGFEVSNIQGNLKGTLARVDTVGKPRLGKYKINLKELDHIGVASIEDAIQRAEVVVIDEVGPMELSSQAFRDTVQRAMSSGKSVIGTIHYKAQDPLILEIKARRDVEIIEVGSENREDLAREILKRFQQAR